eukprot:764633-Pleurochrysis_carterae.AAC.1
MGLLARTGRGAVACTERQSSARSPSPRCVATDRRGVIQAPPVQACAHATRPPRRDARVARQEAAYRPRPLR